MKLDQRIERLDRPAPAPLCQLQISGGSWGVILVIKIVIIVELVLI